MLGLDKTLSLSLSLPHRDATVIAIMYQAATQPGNVPKREVQSKLLTVLMYFFVLEGKCVGATTPILLCATIRNYSSE